MNSILNLKNVRLVEGDTNSLGENQVLVKRNPVTGKVSLYMRLNGEIKNITQNEGDGGGSDEPGEYVKIPIDDSSLSGMLNNFFLEIFSTTSVYGTCANDITDYLIVDAVDVRPVYNASSNSFTITFRNAYTAPDSKGVTVPLEFKSSLIPTLHISLSGAPNYSALPISFSIPEVIKIDISNIAWMFKGDTTTVGFTITISTAIKKLQDALMLA